MPKLTTINITKPQREELEKVREFLEEEYGVNPSLVDCIGHLIRFWNQKKGKESGPTQARNSNMEE